MLTVWLTFLNISPTSIWGWWDIMSSVYMHGTGTSISITSLIEQLEMQDVGFEAETASPRGSANWRCGQVPLTLKYPRCGEKNGIHFSPVVEGNRSTKGLVIKINGRDVPVVATERDGCHLSISLHSKQSQHYKSVGLFFKRDDQSWMGEVCFDVNGKNDTTSWLLGESAQPRLVELRVRLRGRLLFLSPAVFLVLLFPLLLGFVLWTWTVVIWYFYLKWTIHLN